MVCFVIEGCKPIHYKQLDPVLKLAWDFEYEWDCFVDLNQGRKHIFSRFESSIRSWAENFQEIAVMTLKVNSSNSMISNQSFLIAPLSIMLLVSVSVVSTSFRCVCIWEGTLISCGGSSLSSDKQFNACFIVDNILWICNTNITSLNTKPAYVRR